MSRRFAFALFVAVMAVAFLMALLSAVDRMWWFAALFGGVGLLSAGAAMRNADPTLDDPDKARVGIVMQRWQLDELTELAEQQDCDVAEFMRRATAHYRKACLEGRVVVPAGPECEYCDLPKGHDGEHASW